MTRRPARPTEHLHQSFVAVQLHRRERLSMIRITRVPLSRSAGFGGCHFWRCLAALYYKPQDDGPGIQVCVANKLRYLFRIGQPEGPWVSFADAKRSGIAKRQVGCGVVVGHPLRDRKSV